MRSNRPALALLQIGAALELLGCGSSSSTGPAPAATVASITFAADSLVGDSLHVLPGDTARVKATALDAQGHPVTGVALVWSSSDTKVAKVSTTGLVAAVGLGEANISVTVQGASSHVVAPAGRPSLNEVRTERLASEAHVRVFAYPRIEITPSSPQSIDVGRSVSYTGTIVVQGQMPSDWVIGGPGWTSSNPGVASVDDQGVAKGLSPGTTTITATLDIVTSTVNASFTAYVQLTVRKCGGIASVTSWSVDTAAVRWAPPSFTYQVETIVIDHKTLASGTLSVVHQNADSTTWFGFVTGSVSLADNATIKMNGQTIVTDETANAAMLSGAPSGANVKLVVYTPSSNACSYRLVYQESFDYTLASVGGSSVLRGDGIATDVGSVPIRPGQGGLWHLMGTSFGNRSVLQTYVNPPPPPGPSYFPGTDLGIGYAGLNSTAAVFSYLLTSH